MANYEAQQPTVYTKATWSGNWSAQQYLWCDRLSLTASPEVDSAQFHWSYAGEKMRQGDQNFLPYPPKDLRGQYVKVVWESNTLGTTREWVGVIVHEIDAQDATNNASQQIGTQTFTAMGLEWLLDREQIRTTVVQAPGGSTANINRVLDFNLGGSNGREVALAGNRAKTGGNHFASDLSDATEWDALQVVQYLIEEQGPKDQYGNADIPFRLTAFNGISLVDVILQIPAQRRTPKQIIDALVNQYRGLGYTLSVNASNEVQLFIYSYAQSDINLPGGGTLTANHLQWDLDLESDILVSPPIITYDGASQYDRVLVRGEQATFTGTFTYQDGLERQWSDTDETTYGTAASGETGYGDATIEEQMQWNSEFRSSDLMRKVFSYARVPTDWDGQLNSEAVDPLSKPQWIPGLRFLPYTLLKEYYDYDGSNIEDYDPEDAMASNDLVANVPSGVTPEYRRPFGVIADVDSRYAYVDRLSDQGDFDDTAHTDGRTWRASVRVQDDLPGLILHVIGADQHVFAKDDFTPSIAADTASDFQPELSWKNVEFTASMGLDYYAEAEYPASIVGARDFISTKVINVPNMRLDYVVPSTIVGIDADGTKLESEGGYVQDDRTKLQDIARLAYEWYSTDRVAVQFTYKTTKVALSPGEMIATITSGGTPQNINSVITRVDFDFVGGYCAVSTGYGELDFGGFAT